MPPMGGTPLEPAQLQAVSAVITGAWGTGRSRARRPTEIHGLKRGGRADDPAHDLEAHAPGLDDAAAALADRAHRRGASRRRAPRPASRAGQPRSTELDCTISSPAVAPPCCCCTTRRDPVTCGGPLDGPARGPSHGDRSRSPGRRRLGQASRGLRQENAGRGCPRLAQSLGERKVTVVGHDIGLMVAYAYAAQYPAEVDPIALMDGFLPGVATGPRSGCCGICGTSTFTVRRHSNWFGGASGSIWSTSGTTSRPIATIRYPRPMANARLRPAGAIRPASGTSRRSSRTPRTFRGSPRPS